MGQRSGAMEATVARVRARELLRRVRPALVALVAGTGLALVALLHTGGPTASHVARACGLGGGPTMLANQSPALLYPVTQNVPADQPIGIFADQYAASRSVTFSEDLSQVPNPPPATSLKWRWNFGDGSGYSYQITPTHTFAHAGTYNIHSQIYDTTSASWTDLDSAQIQVAGSVSANPPVAQATATAQVVGIGNSITFDASGSHSADGSPLTYEWNFGDASTAQGVHVTHQFVIPGKGFVALVVTDGHGARSVARVNVLIVTQLPEAALSASATNVSAGDSVTFDATRSLAPTEPQGDQIVKFAWDFGDGTPPVETQQPTVGHTFAKAGTFGVVVQAIDTQGAAGTAKVVVTVLGGGGASSGTSRASQAPWGILVAGAVALLALLGAGYVLVQTQRKRVALIRQHERAQELLRARPVGPAAHPRPPANVSARSGATPTRPGAHGESREPNRRPRS